jgi:nucleoid DNA-binding protein
MSATHTVSRTRGKRRKARRRARSHSAPRRPRSVAEVVRLNGRTKLTDGVIAEHVAKLTDLSLTEAKAIVDRVFHVMRVTLLADKPVSLPAICTLTPYNKKARHFRHPQTGQLIFKERCRYVRLTLAQSFRQELGADGAES